MKKVKFSLIKEDAVLTDEQQKRIRRIINSHKCYQLSNLIDVKLLEITSKYFVVEVEETSNQWHNRFSKIICSGAELEHLRIVLKNDKTRLFDTSDID